MAWKFSIRSEYVLVTTLCSGMLRKIESSTREPNRYSKDVEDRFKNSIDVSISCSIHWFVVVVEPIMSNLNRVQVKKYNFSTAMEYNKSLPNDTLFGGAHREFLRLL